MRFVSSCLFQPHDERLYHAIFDATLVASQPGHILAVCRSLLFRRCLFGRHLSALIVRVSLPQIAAAGRKQILYDLPARLLARSEGKEGLAAAAAAPQ